MKFVRALLALSLALGGAVMASDHRAEATPEGFESTNVITGLNRPTNVEFSPDGRVFIAEQGGVLKVFDDVDDSSPTTVIDIRPSVHSVNGRGLLGLALDPDFPATPHIYIMYSLDAPIGGTPPTYGTVTGSNDECPVPPGPGKCVIGARISRLVLDGDVAVSETTILEDWCQEWTSHSIGDLRFDSEGSLYATGGDGAFAGQPDWGQRAGQNGCGDPPIPHGGVDQPPATAEGGALRAQDLRTPGDPAGLNGTVIRIDKNTGEAHPDNPNFGDADPNVARVVAYGLRNPYRTAMRPGTDELWLGDVGWNDWEELNVIADPDSEVLNFGWPCYEGPDLGYDIGADICTDLVAEGPDAVEAPYWMYEQRVGIVEGGDGCLNNNGSLSALTFYEGGAYPDEHDGALFFGDYSRRCMWEMLAGPDGRPDPSTVRVINDDIAVTDLAVGPGGDIYAVNVFGGGPIGGTLVRLSYPNGVAEPTARLSVQPSQGPAPLSVTLDASASTPSVPGQAMTFDWDLDGDGVFGEADGAIVDATYVTDGVFTAQVRVSDPEGRSDLASQVIRVGTPPVVTITSPTPDTTWKVDDSLPFAGSAVDADGDPIPAADLEWDLIFHHCETLDDCHTHNIGTVEGVDSGSFLAPEHEYPTYIEVALTATNAEGLSTTASVDLFPVTTTLTLDSDEPGLTLGFNGKPVSTPSVNEVIVGTNNTISAPASQNLGAVAYLFQAWSDGGPRTHDILVGEPTTVTASHVSFAEPTLLVDDVSTNEETGPRTTVSIPIRLSSPHTQFVSVRVALNADTATAARDFVRWSPRTVNFRPGETEQVVKVTIIGDNLDEADEEFHLDLSSPRNAPIGVPRATITILDDDDPPTLTVKDRSIVEGDTGSKTARFQLRLSGRSDQAVSVDIATVDGTATGGADYEPIDVQTVTFPPRSTSRNVSVRILGDIEAEGDETFDLGFSNIVNATLDEPSATFTIVDNEPALAIRDASLVEGVLGERMVRLTVKLSKRAASEVAVDWATVDGTAVAPGDYTASSGTLVFPRGVTTRQILVGINGDTEPEPDEDFTVQLSDAVGATIADPDGVATIRSDDYEPSIAIADASRVEAGATVRLVVTLDQKVTQRVRVTYTTVDGDAVAPGDYVAKGPSVLTFTPGSTRRTISIPIKHDLLAEGDEQFRVVLSNPDGGQLADGEGIVTIIDND